MSPTIMDRESMAVKQGAGEVKKKNNPQVFLARWLECSVAI